eukprot:4869915-Prymnesium_polylepis.1
MRLWRGPTGEALCGPGRHAWLCAVRLMLSAGCGCLPDLGVCSFGNWCLTCFFCMDDESSVTFTFAFGNTKQNKQLLFCCGTGVNLMQGSLSIRMHAETT